MSDLLLGAVAYDAKVVPIWEGFRTWLREKDFDFDFVLYSNYERQVDDLIENRIDVAWNSPLAFVRARRVAAARGETVRAVIMRDSDRDLTSVIIVPTSSTISSLEEFANGTIGVGTIDSPQARLLPLSYLRSRGVDLDGAVTVRRFDIGVGLHGDHIGGERDAVRALLAGEVDAACLIDANLLLFSKEGTLPSGSVQVLGETAPYDHCNMTAAPQADSARVDRFADLLLEMSYADERVRPLMDLEGLTRWLPARTERYAALEKAVDELGFYSPEGRCIAPDYRP